MFDKKVMLIVDDSLVERTILLGYAEKMGFIIHQAENGEEGIKKADEIRPDVILMDVVMPGLNGFQATRQINRNEELKNIPVIMCTSKSDETDKLWGKRQGASAYLVKPVKLEELVSALKSVL